MFKLTLIQFSHIQVAFQGPGNPTCCLWWTWLCRGKRSVQESHELQQKVPNSLASATWPCQTQFLLHSYYKRVLQYNWMMHQQLFNMPLRPLETVFALTSVALNAKCSHNNQQESAAFLWQGHFFFCWETKESRDPSEEKVRARAGWEGGKWRAAASLFPFYRQRREGFPTQPMRFPVKPNLTQALEFPHTMECAQNVFHRQGERKKMGSLSGFMTES